MQPLLDVHIHLRGGEAQGSNDPVAYHTIALGCPRRRRRSAAVAARSGACRPMTASTRVAKARSGVLIEAAASPRPKHTAELSEATRRVGPWRTAPRRSSNQEGSGLEGGPDARGLSPTMAGNKSVATTWLVEASLPDPIEGNNMSPSMDLFAVGLGKARLDRHRL